MDTQIFSKIGQLLVKSKNTLILLPAQPSVDAAAAALSFYLSLEATGKRATIACSEKIPVGLNRLIGVDKISNQVGGQNLVVAFEYLEDSIEKVSYNINDGKFNLVIQPKDGFPPLDYQKLSYKYSGSTADLVVVIGCQKPENIGRIYTEEKKLFSDQETINIDINHFNSRYGKTNFIDSIASSCSELVGLVIKNLNMTVNPDVATNILAGMETATNNFAMKTRAETFELIGWTMHYGGRRSQMQTVPSRQPFDTRPFIYQPMAGRPTGIASTPIRRPAYPPQSIATQPSHNQPPLNQTAYQPQAYEPPVKPFQAAPFSVNEPVSPQTFPPMSSYDNPTNNKQQPISVTPKQVATEPAPPEWLKPKIYKGSSQV